MQHIVLLKISQSLRPGQAIKISQDDMIDAAKREQRSLLFASVNHQDVINFADKISTNWGIHMTYDDYYRQWTMYCPIEHNVELSRRLLWVEQQLTIHGRLQ